MQEENEGNVAPDPELGEETPGDPDVPDAEDVEVAELMEEDDDTEGRRDETPADRQGES